MAPDFTKATVKTTPGPTSMPPDLSLPQDFPPLAAPCAPAPILPPTQRKVTKKNIKPIIPVIPSSSTRLTDTQKDLQVVEQAATDVKATPADAHVAPQNSKLTGLSKVQATEEDQVSNFASSLKPTSVKGEAAVTSTFTATEEKPRPGKLDIAAAKQTPKAYSADAKSTAGDGSSALDLSQPPTPATAASQVSVSSRSKHSRTIRVSREDVQQQPDSPGTLVSATTSRQASRRPSLTSANRPETPVSEKLSDNASFTTTSMSRANSPPPSKVGSAPVRQVTKSQQKKERQNRAKIAEAIAKVEVPAKTEEVQAPIVGRKKKTRKERTQGTAESTPTATRPTSPVLKEEATEAKDIFAPTSMTPVKENKRNAPKGVSDVREPDTPSSPATPSGTEQQKHSLTAAAIFAYLQKTGKISASAADLFKPVPGVNHRFEVIDPGSSPVYDSVSDDQARLLEDGEPIHVDNGRNNQVIYFPNRRCLRGLTAEQAARYVELRKQPLFNGEVPSHQALDSLIPSPPVDTALVVSTARGVVKNKRLDNPFTVPAAVTGLNPINITKHSTAGTVGEDGMQRGASMSVTDAEHTLQLSRRDTEMLEKKLNAVLKKNRRLLFGNAH
ncbi:hypothetical protein P7C71_g1028, partial [Lecanoromycetidae sp. Uapishka_2]